MSLLRRELREEHPSNLISIWGAKGRLNQNYTLIKINGGIEVDAGALGRFSILSTGAQPPNASSARLLLGYNSLITLSDYSLQAIGYRCRLPHVALVQGGPKKNNPLAKSS